MKRACPQPARAAPPGRRRGFVATLLATLLLPPTRGEAQVAPGPGEVPVYRTTLPAAAELDYELHHGLISGRGRLTWQPGAAGYRLAMHGTAFGLTLLEWVSAGHFDAAGLAPDRFTDDRIRRAALSASFDRAAGRITYSADPALAPLVPGTQDRLSWMVQLPAIVAANPTLRATASEIVMFVTGARADADVWTFVVRGREDLDLPAGRVAGALHVARAPRKARDSQAEAWLDPARGWLPVKAHLATNDSADATDFLLARSRGS